MKSMIRALAAAGIALAGWIGSAQAAPMATWGFEVVTPTPTTDSATIGPLSPDSGAGSLTGVHTSAATDWTTPNGNGSNTSLNSNTWAIGDYYQFEVSTAGFEDVMITWSQTRSSNGPTTWDLQYATTTAGPFTTFLDNYTVPQVAWDATITNGSSSFSQDLSSVTSIDNGSVVFRLVAQTAPVNSGGQSRIDSIIVGASPIPEPSAFAVLGLVFCAGLLRRGGRASMHRRCEGGFSGAGALIHREYTRGILVALATAHIALISTSPMFVEAAFTST